MKLKLVVLVVSVLVIGTLTAFMAPPSNIVYHPFDTVEVRANADGTGNVLGHAYSTAEYRVVEYNWTPATSSNSWALIEFKSGKKGYAPVQIGYTVYGTVKYNVGVICCGSLPAR